MTRAVVQDLLVRKSIVVNAPQDHVFRTFVERIDTWWPRSHHIGKEPFAAIIEPRAGGRWFERDGDGQVTNWGHVIAYEPPRRVLLAWDLDHEWKFTEGLNTEVEVTFESEGRGRTRVVLEHRRLDRYGDKAEMMRALFDGKDAWQGILEAFGKAAGRDHR
ncbi:MAG TPA: SRPBCC family protein [Usitatibacter sp.]|jgi:uncharacterized protein YndB with AHSA1/START domain|nr:SRPBCC family protein [Usitatibacter sp.]